MATKKELEAQLASLQAENEALKKTSSQPMQAEPVKIEKGRTYHTAWGVCMVTGISDHEGIEKVYGEWQPFNRMDFETPEGEPYLRSMPVRKFLKGYYDYPKFKAQRKLELAQGAN